ncbi:MAG: purine-nucleoside phosphorylase [Lactobacillaceae bacterium]|jgi:inosine/guanosine/xanthosine phosphorylase family protein|nr:purine-nucleoside phosphorylase [Lactobacillaceae bacterium]
MIDKISAQIKNKIGNKQPKTAIILGSGLGKIADELTDKTIIKYEDIEGFPQSSVSGHAGQLVIGRLEGVEILCMQGRVHLYEGHKPQSIDLIIKSFKKLGIEYLIVTNAAGSLDINMPAGSLMLIKDHINFSGQNPLVGVNDDKSGPRFPDLSNAYDHDIRNIVKNTAKKEDIKLYEGVYLMVLGPNFETAAEIKAFRILGADAVGMSTVPEVVSAVHSGMKVLGFSVITNLGTGMRDGKQSHEETLHEGKKASQNLINLLKAYIKETKNG